MATYQTSEEYLYNPGTDLLLNWGNHILERPEFKTEREELAEMLDTWERKDLLSDAEASLSKLLEEAEQARRFLIRHPILPGTSSDAEWHTAVDALDALDRLLYFWFSCAEFLRPESEAFVKRIENAYLKLTEWMEKAENFSALRLVSMNEWRRIRLSRIEPDNHYLYPWYDELSEMDKDTVYRISESWKRIVDEGYEALDFIAGDDRPLVWMYLERDRGLKAELVSIARVNDLISEVIEENPELRLLNLSSLQTKIRPAPRAYAEAGLVNIAYRVLMGAAPKITGEIDFSATLQKAVEKGMNPEKIFLAAFCGPNLTNEDRLQAFRSIGKEIRGEGVYDRGDIFSQVDRWRRYEIRDADLSDHLFGHWNALRQQAFEEIEAAVPDVLPFPESFAAQAAAFGRHAVDSIRYGFENRMNWISRGGHIFASGYSSGGDVSEEKKIAYALEESNAIILPMTADASGSLAILSEIEGNEELNDLLDAFEQEGGFAGGIYKQKNREAERTEIKRSLRKIRKAFKDFKEEDLEFIAIGLSSAKEPLEKALSGMEPDTKEEASQVIWIIYLPEEK